MTGFAKDFLAFGIATHYGDFSWKFAKVRKNQNQKRSNAVCSLVGEADRESQYMAASNCVREGE